MKQKLFLLPILLLLFSSCESNRLIRKSFYGLQALSKKQQETIEMQKKQIELMAKNIESLDKISTRLATQLDKMEAEQAKQREIAAESTDIANNNEVAPTNPYPSDTPAEKTELSAAKPNTTAKKSDKKTHKTGIAAIAKPTKTEAEKPTEKPTEKPKTTAEPFVAKISTKQKSSSLKSDILLRNPIKLGRPEIKDIAWKDATKYEIKPEYPQTLRERAMLREINMVRANPKGYIAFIQAFIDDHLKGTFQPSIPKVTSSSYTRNGQTNWKYDTVWTTPGYDSTEIDRVEIAAARELIQELSQLSPLGMLQPACCLAEAAEQHGRYLQTIGKIAHVDGEGKMALDRLPKGCNVSGLSENLCAGTTSVRQALIQLLVDARVAGRGHRRALLSAKQTKIGVYEIGAFGKYATGWVQEYSH